MKRLTSSLAMVTVVFGLVGSAAAQGPSSVRTDEIILRFNPGAVVQKPLGGNHKAIGSFSFVSQQLTSQLNSAGVETLEPLFPSFSPQDVASHNLLGEDILLDDLSQIYRARLRTGKNPEAAAAQLRKQKEIVYAEADRQTQALSIPNDTFFGLQWWAHNPGPPLCGGHPIVPDVDINAPEAWDQWTGNTPSLRVGVLDTGIQSTHPDLAGRVVLGPSYAGGTSEDNNGHGTACAGIIGASGNNGIGTAGVTWGTTQVSVKVLDGTGSGQWSWLAQGLDWARTQGNIPIINLSIGGPSLDATVRTACKNAFLSGQFLSTAMGNDNSGTASYPAAFSISTFSVGALFADRSRWRDVTLPCGGTFGSNTGSWIDVAAPGGRMIATTKIGSDWYDFNPCTCPPDAFGGTSAATPVVAGIAALLRSKYPTLLGEDLEQIISRTAVDITSTGVGFDNETGFGLPRADAALNFLAAPRALYQFQVSTFTDLGYTNVGPMTMVNVPGLPTGVYYPRRHQLRGTVTFGPPYVGPPDVWIRRSGTISVSFSNPYDASVEFPRAEIVPGSVTSTGCQVYAYVHEIYDAGGAFRGWYPSAPSGARVAITAVGYAPDLVAPAAVTNLNFTTSGTSDGTVTWTAPGDDGNVGTATSYDLRYSTSPINAGNFASATSYAAPAPGPAGTFQSVTVHNLTPCTRYYWAIKTSDEVPNVSALSNLPSADTGCPPAAVTNLGVGVGRTTAAVYWTAPGDDGNVGTATEYDLRRSSGPINDGNFTGAIRVTTGPPQEAGSSECVEMSGLGSCSPNYWALKTRDDEGLWSPISNVPYAVTRCSGFLEVACAGAQASMSPVAKEDLPAQLEIGAPSPNPAEVETRLSLAIPADLGGTRLEVAVYDISGRRVKLIQGGTAEPGRHLVSWDLRGERGERVNRGVYFLRTSIGGRVETRKLLLVR